MKISQLMISLLMLSGTAQAASVQCRGMDGFKEQVAVRISDIQVGQERTPVGGSMKIITLKGRDVVCDEVTFTGDRKDQMSASCQSEQADLSLTMKIKNNNKYEGVFCGAGQNTQAGRIHFTDKACLQFYCDAQDLSN